MFTTSLLPIGNGHIFIAHEAGGARPRMQPRTFARGDAQREKSSTHRFWTIASSFAVRLQATSRYRNSR